MVSIGDASVKTMEKIGNNWSSTINIWKLKLFNHQNTRYLTWWFPRSPKLQVEMFTMLRWYRVLTYVVAIIQVTIPSHLFWIMLDLIKQNMGCDGNSWDIWNEKHKNSWFLCVFSTACIPHFSDITGTIVINHCWLVVSTNPSEKYESQLGWWNSEWFSSHVPNHQPDINHH